MTLLADKVLFLKKDYIMHNIKPKYFFVFFFLFVVNQLYAQKGDHHISMYGGRSNYLIDLTTGQTSFLYNKGGIEYGYSLGGKINLFFNGELGSLISSNTFKTPLFSNCSCDNPSPIIISGSLKSQQSSASLGVELILIKMNKISLKTRIGSNYQVFENSIINVLGEKNRREFSGFMGFQIDYKLNNKWTFFINAIGNKPYLTSLNDPNFYMSNNSTDITKDLMIGGVFGISFNLENKKNKDSDQDGVKDFIDKCPNTPNGESVNIYGCSQSQLDDDNDGIVNKFDKCPFTSEGEKVNVNGCSISQLDDDNDGVSNQLDICPNTLKGEKVNVNGCSEAQMDDDNDGVNNLNDHCQNTQPNQRVNSNGCALNQIDNDQDGIFDDIDNCPEEKGNEINHGCPDITNKIQNHIIEIAKEINFVTGKADLLTISQTKLDELSVILLENPNLKIIISGHTDDLGNTESNLKLSQRRAETVMNYLVKKGIDKNRITAMGFGEGQLKINETSNEARAINRRVEIKIIN